MGIKEEKKRKVKEFIMCDIPVQYWLSALSIVPTGTAVATMAFTVAWLVGP